MLAKKEFSKWHYEGRRLEANKQILILTWIINHLNQLMDWDAWMNGEGRRRWGTWDIGWCIYAGERRAQMRMTWHDMIWYGSWYGMIYDNEAYYMPQTKDIMRWCTNDTYNGVTQLWENAAHMCVQLLIWEKRIGRKEIARNDDIWIRDNGNYDSWDGETRKK